MISETFEAQLLQAVVRQFFENPPLVGTTPDGQYINIPSRPTPAQIVAARLLSDKSEELLTAILEAIDLDALAADVAEKFHAELLKPENRGYGFSYDRSAAAKARKALKERIDNRLVELIAQDTFAQMKAAEQVPDV